MKITKSQLKQIIKEELLKELDPNKLEFDPDAEEFASRDLEKDAQTAEDITEMYDELLGDLEEVEDPRMQAKLISLFQSALESEGEVFKLQP